ncbi:MAG: TonB-dependent receptor [Prevotellaceae bacterium]|jgi:TonB-linked SusC/RagA family outer membrane protein|nr:TonB-dependent receptor [Prevotellaceae bacterium]
MEKQVNHFRKPLVRLVFGLALMLVCSVAIAQNRQVTGVVVDAAGETIIGASVVEKGNTGNGAVTDIDGRFSINVPTNATLTVSYVGYQPQDVALQGRVVVNVTLQEDSELLDEVVVVGYGVQRKSDLTGAIASVNADDIKGLATSDAAAALQGKAAGIQILNTSGAPGQGAQIRIRGYSSNSGNLGPLLIVDGLKVDNIQYLDPSMIKSIEILKDAASAAIYGAEAGNGVVLITTQSGSGDSGRPKITYSFKGINQSLGKLPEIFGAKDWIAYKEASGYDMVGLTAQYGVDYNNPQETNWVKEVFGDSWSTQHSVTFQDGNDKGHFFTSINYLDNDGIVRGDKDTYQRLSAQLNADYQLYKWIKVGTNTNIEKWATRSVTQQSAYGSMMAPVLLLDPLTPVYWDDPSEFTGFMKDEYAKNPDRILKAPNGRYYATSKFQMDDNGNPLLQRDRNNASNGGYTVRGTAFMDLTPIKELVLTSRFSYRIAQSNSHSYDEPYYMNGQAKDDEYNISAGANNSVYYQWENFANFNKLFAEKHLVGAMVGMSYTDNYSDNVSASAQGSGGAKILSGDAPNFRYLNYVNSASSTAKSIGNSPGRSTSLSYFGRLLYTFDNRYSIQFNYRADAFDTSKLPSGKNRWGMFPSASVGWTLTNEKFIKDIINPNTISFIKFRASWGRNGNINVLNNYPYTASIAYNSAWYQYGNDPAQHYGSYPDKMANPNLKWETSEQLDFGLDMRFLNNRLTASLDYYNKDTKDLLVSISPLYEVYANSQTTVNAGSINNHGFEMELGWRDNIGDLVYSVNANMATLSNKVTYLDPSLPRIDAATGGAAGTNNKVGTAFEKDHTIWYFRTFDYVGPDANGAPQYRVFRDLDGDGKAETEKIVGSSELVDGTDKTDIGSAIPKVTYGITLNLMYKNFDFTLFGTGAAGNKIFNVLYRYDTPLRNSLKFFYENAWTPENTGASMPKADIVVNDQNFWSSSANLFDGSYFKIKQLQLGYTLPRNLTQKLMIKNLRLYVSLDDFFTFASYPGMDPETATIGSGNSAGFDIGSYPTMKKVTLGASIAF